MLSVILQRRNLTMLLKRFMITLCLLLSLSISAHATLNQSSNDGSILKQIIIFGRHGVRAPTTDRSNLPQMSVDAYPEFEVPAGYLTSHGYQAEVLLGAFFRSYLIREGLLTGSVETDAVNSYFRANSIQRSNVTAAAFSAGLLPNVTPAVQSYPLGQPDPVFDPIAANVVTVDTDRAVMEANGIFNNGAALISAYSGEYSLIRSVLQGYPLGTQPPPLTPNGLVDPTILPIPLTANTSGLSTGNVIDIGGLGLVNEAVDPFVMEYANGFPLNQVAWGRLTLDTLSQQTRIISYVFNIELLSPYLNQLQSSNAAAHILRTMEQAAYHKTLPGSFGNANSRCVVVISSDGYVAGLAGLLRLHWQLPGYQPDYCAPGGALVFELRQSLPSKEHFVRIYYTAQTFDQLRNLTPLTLDAPPAGMQLLIPDDSRASRSLDIRFSSFRRLVERAMNPMYVQNPFAEIPPGILTDVPLN